MASWDNEPVSSALVLTSFLQSDDLIEAIVQDFGLTPDPDASRTQRLKALNHFLLERAAQGETCVLIIDDAQALDEPSLDLVRQLSNLETARQKLLQIILCGQPELIQKLQSPALRQVYSRVAVFRSIRHLPVEQVGPYIQHRLKSVGMNQPDFVGPEALDEVVRLSRGNPRLIHHLMDRSLYAWMLTPGQVLTVSHVHLAWDDIQPPKPEAVVGALPQDATPKAAPAPVRSGHWRYLAVAMGLGTLLILAGAWYTGDAQRGWMAWRERLHPPPIISEAEQPAPADEPPPVMAAAHEAQDPEVQRWREVVQQFDGLSGNAQVATFDPKAAEVWAAQWPANTDQAGAWSPVMVSAWPPACEDYPVFRSEEGPDGATGYALTFVPHWLTQAPLRSSVSEESTWRLQVILAHGGWLEGTQLDGVMGPKTTAALRDFQQHHALEASGNLDLPTALVLACTDRSHIKPLKASVDG
jgi:general secretion pathway protein A